MKKKVKKIIQINKTLKKMPKKSFKFHNLATKFLNNLAKLKESLFHQYHKMIALNTQHQEVV